MSDLFNVQTQKAEYVPDSEIDKALASGTHAYKPGTIVQLYNPEKDEYSTIPAENISYALQQGYKVYTPSLDSIQQAREENSGLKGAAKVFGAQALNQLSFGASDIAYNKLADPLEIAKFEAIKKDHELANIAGGATGFAGSMIAGGPLFKGASAAGKAVEAGIAAKLGTELAGEVSARTLGQVSKSIAKNLAAKTAGGAVEGALISAPAGLTEAVLGDPDAAAEHLMSGGLIGGFFGAGSATLSGIAKIGKYGVGKAAEAVGQDAPEAVSKIFKSIAETSTGVKAEELERYAASKENAARINELAQQGSIPELWQNTADQASTFLRQLDDNITLAKQGFETAEGKADEAAGYAKLDLQKKAVPDNALAEIKSAISDIKTQIGEHSSQADDVLAKSGIEMPKAKIIGSLETDLKKSLGKIVTKQDQAAHDAVDNIISNIKQNYPEMILGQEVRDIVQKTRELVQFNQGAGEFNSSLELGIKKFSRNLSNNLKELPEYADRMGQMSNLSRTLEKANNLFGTPEKALSSLKKAVDPDKGRFVNEALNDLSTATGKNLGSHLEELQGAKTLLEKGKVEGIRGDLVPGLHADAGDARRLYEDAVKERDKYHLLNPSSVFQTIKNVGNKGKDLRSLRQLEELGSKFGVDLVNRAKDIKTLDAFARASTNGSRKTMLGAAIGTALGGPVGGAIGGAGGYLADRYSGQILKKSVDMAPDTAGLLFVEQRMKQAAEKLDEIPKILESMSKGGFKNTRGAGISFLSQLANDDDKKVPLVHNAQDLQKLNDKLSKWAAHPEVTADAVASMMAPVTKKGAPRIGGAVSGKIMKSLDYIDKAMPKPPTLSSPFAPKSVKWRPSNHDLSAFNQKLQVVHDPYVVLSEFAKGTLTHNHMDALTQIYPGLQSAIQSKVMNMVVDGKAPELSFDQRMKLSLLVGVPVDEALKPENVQFYQQIAMGPSAEQQAAQDSAKYGFKLPDNVNLAQDNQSEIQRLQNRQA